MCRIGIILIIYDHNVKITIKMTIKFQVTPQ